MYRVMQPYDNRLNFTPQKTVSSLQTNPSNSVEPNFSLNFQQHGLSKSNTFLELQSNLSFGQSEIKKQEIMGLLNSIKIVRFLSKEVKSLSNIITAKQRTIQGLTVEKQQTIANINQIRVSAEHKKTAYKSQNYQLDRRRKCNSKIIDHEIDLLKQKILRIKSLGSDSQCSNRSYFQTQRPNKTINQKHRRLYSEQSGRKQKRRTRQKQIFVPIYIPYFIPHHYNHQVYNPPYPASYNSLNLVQRHREINGSSNNPMANQEEYSNFEENQRQSRMKSFNSRLKESLTNRESQKFSRKQSQKIQKHESLRNSSRSNQAQVKPKLSFKAPFETDDQANTDQYGVYSFVNKNNNYSKMGIKITQSNTCEQQQLQFIKKTKVAKIPVQRMKATEEFSNSTVNLDVPSDKKQNSSWQKETIQALKIKQTINNKKKISDKSSSAIQVLQSDSSLNGSDVNIALSQSPIKNTYHVPKLTKGFSSSESDGHELRLIRAKQEKKDSNAFETISHVQIMDIPSEVDEDIIGSINLLAESKISRNSIPKHNNETKKQEKKEEEDQMLSLINLAPESRISRLSRQKEKGTVRTSKSDLRETKRQQQSEEERTALSQIHHTNPKNHEELSSSQQKEKQAKQYQTYIRTTTPSRIVKKGFKTKSQFKNNIDLMGVSIQEASQEEEANSLSEIMLKMGKKNNNRNK